MLENFLTSLIVGALIVGLLILLGLLCISYPIPALCVLGVGLVWCIGDIAIKGVLIMEYLKDLLVGIIYFGIPILLLGLSLVYTLAALYVIVGIASLFACFVAGNFIRYMRS